VSENPYWALAIVFVPLSLASIGGGLAVLPAIQRQAVDVHQWMSAREFVELFAVARIAPGPGSMLVTLVGWKVAGWSGALLATLAMFVPSSLLCLLVARAWSRHRGKAWHAVLEEGLAPIGSGLILAGAFLLFRLSGGGVATLLVAFATTALMFWRPRILPLVPMFGAGALFALWSLAA
jgi:chromate transporter